MRWPSWRRWLAGSAAVAGALAPLAGSPYRRAAQPQRPGAESSSSSHGSAGARSTPGGSAESINVAELTRVVADQDDHITAVELAAWLRAGKHRVRVVDVRTPSEFAIYHIPGAENVPIESLTAVPFPAEDTVVLYSEVGIHGAQAWVFLRALGHRRVFFLRNGLHEWLDDVMSPTIAESAPADAQAAFDRVAELSRFFGGMPRKLAGRADPSEDAPRARRRGC